MKEVLALVAAIGWIGLASAQAKPQKSVDDVLAGMGLQSTRGIDTDICYPATATEYQALGKNAILMLKSTSALSTELPLRAVYLIHRTVRIPLQRIAITAKQEREEGRTTQYSFYLIPIHYMKQILECSRTSLATDLGLVSLPFPLKVATTTCLPSLGLMSMTRLKMPI